MRNPLLSKKLKRTETRLLIIDDNQIRFNQIRDILTANEHQVQATLLDDLQNFEKQLNRQWDLVIFGRAYDLKYEQALSIIQLSQQPTLPILLLKPEDYSLDQYASYIRKGVYDIVDLGSPDRFYIDLFRALSFSRLTDAQQHLMTELETAQNQAQAFVTESHKAIAVIQEGIHIDANEEYLKLFGFKSNDDIIGLPLLDVLQPQDLTDFKFRFKKISQGQFDLGRFDLKSQNGSMSAESPLKIEFMPAAEDDALQITIDMGNEGLASAGAAEKSAGKPNSYQLINRTAAKQPSDTNALVTFSLATCPDSIFLADWETFKSYFNEIKIFLKDQTNAPLFKLESGVYAGLIQAESQAKLESKLIGLNSLSKPQLLNIGPDAYPLHMRLGYTLLTSEIRDEAHFDQLIGQAFTTALPKNQPAPELDLGIPDLQFSIQEPVQQAPAIPVIAETAVAAEIPNISFTAPEIIPPTVLNEPAVLKALRACMERGEIHLKYQQLYDKEDADLYTYEVTSGFIFENKWQDISQLRELAEDKELSIKLDRWILVESCKQLHNFITQYPEAKLIINLNKDVLLNDNEFPSFIAKLISIIRSKLQYPLILQFSEEDLNQNIEAAQKAIVALRQNGAEVAVRDFGHSMFSESLLQKIDVTGLTLHSSLTAMLNADKHCEELQEKITAYREIKPVQIMLRELNDMTLFANAWNVDARYIQGDYFQKKLDHLIDVQNQ